MNAPLSPQTLLRKEDQRLITGTDVIRYDAARGEIAVNGVAARTRDGVAVSGESLLRVTATSDAEVVLVETG